MIDELKQWEYDRGYEKGKTEVLDKIRAEIKKIPTAPFATAYTAKNEALKIINKYRKEQELPIQCKKLKMRCILKELSKKKYPIALVILHREYLGGFMVDVIHQ